MSTIESDAVTAATGTNTDLTISGKGTGVPDIAAGFKVGGVAGVPTASIQDNAVTLAKMAGGTDGNIISYDASGNPVAIATGNDGQVLTSTGAGSPPAFEDAGGGAYEVFASASFSSVSEIEFTSIPSGPFKLRISTHEFSGGETFRMLFAVGGAYLATNYVVGELYNNYSTANGYHLNGQTYFRLSPSGGVAADADSHNFWEIDFLQPEAGASRRNLVRVHKSTAAGSEATVNVSCGFNTATGAISKFKVYPSGGTITGKYTLISHV